MTIGERIETAQTLGWSVHERDTTWAVHGPVDDAYLGSFSSEESAWLHVLDAVENYGPRADHTLICSICGRISDALDNSKGTASGCCYRGKLVRTGDAAFCAIEKWYS